MPQITIQPKPKRLRIGYKFFPRRAGTYVRLPYILLSGKWLGENGFRMGEYVVVEHAEGRIVITSQEVGSREGGSRQ